jgi:Ca2+-binding EF-hand superfamily protein
MISPMGMLKKYGRYTAAVVGLSLIGLAASADLVAAQNQPKATPVVARSAAPPPLSPLLRTPADFLLRRLCVNLTLPGYLELVHRDFDAADTDRDGEISEADDALALQLARATFRAMYLSEVMRADLDGDGVVTEAELRTTLRHDYNLDALAVPDGSTAEQQIEDKIRDFMAADVDHDGRITFEEARNYASTEPDFQTLDTTGAGNTRELLSFRPDGRSVLTLADLDAVAEKLFHDADTDGDGVISADELKPFAHPVPLWLRPAAPAQPPVARVEPSPKPQASNALPVRITLGNVCPMLKPSDTAATVTIATGGTAVPPVGFRPISARGVRWNSARCSACRGPMAMLAVPRWSPWKMASR